MNRGDFQRLADERLAEAQLLLAAGKWAGAYYLAGYAVECALKACILALIEREGTIFENKKFAEKCWTHNLEDLIDLAELSDQLEDWVATNALTEGYWKSIKAWTETSRYQFIDQSRAAGLTSAIEDENHGVMTWIKQHW